MINMIHPPKYPRTYHLPSSPGVQSDDKMHQNTDLIISQYNVITEKLDGGGTMLCAGEVYARSTNQPATQAWFGMVKKHHAWKTSGLSRRLQFFGEDLFGVHSISYDPIEEDKTYRLFAVKSDTEWLSWQDVCDWAEQLNVITVPLVFEGKFASEQELNTWLINNIQLPSNLGGEREGFVLRPKESFVDTDFSNRVAKYVRAGHVQTTEHWTRNWKPCALK
jgi:hypothetical protein